MAGQVVWLNYELRIAVGPPETRGCEVCYGRTLMAASGIMRWGLEKRGPNVFSESFTGQRERGRFGGFHRHRAERFWIWEYRQEARAGQGGRPSVIRNSEFVIPQMDFRDFEARAEQIFREIPEEFKEGVDGLRVVRKTESHPDLPEIYTLGECRSEFYPSDYGGPGVVHSLVYLYYGSFLELSRTRDDWDWEGELWETITHEVRHHLESLADEDALEVQDYVEDQNFKRREGERFDPHFFHMGDALDDGSFHVDGDVFLELTVPRSMASPGADIPVGVEGWPEAVTLPQDAGDIHFMSVDSTEGGERLVVVVRREGAWGWLQRVLSGRTLNVTRSEVEGEET